MKAIEMKVDTHVKMEKRRGCSETVTLKGVVIGNKLRDGDEVVAVEWDDGTVAKVNVNDLHVCHDIEEEFIKTCKEVLPQIYEKMKAAADLINEAEAIADMNGIPFRPQQDIMFCTPSYIPASMDKWNPGKTIDGVNWETIYELTDASGGEYHGWQRSQTC